MDVHTVALEALRGEMNERFARVDQRFDDMEHRFDERLEQRLSDTAAGLRVLIESVQADVRLILEHLAPGLTRINHHEARLDAHDERIGALDTRVTALEVRRHSS
jgi:hypothetical protein